VSRPFSRQDRDDIIALRQAGDIWMAGEPEVAGGTNTVLRRKADGIDRLHLAFSRLDLDEDGDIALAADDVDLAQFGAIAQRQDPITF